MRRLDHVPDGLFDAEPADLVFLVQGPTLLDLRSNDDRPPVFVAVMLHGNETSGWLVAREVLRRCSGKPSCPLVLLIGNPVATLKNVRSINGGFDYNRIWNPGSESQVGRDFWALRQELAKRKVRLAVDVHNNNAPNPYHAICMSRDGDVDALQWALGFSNMVVRSTLSQDTCMEAFAPLCPSVTLECGLPDEQEGISLAVEYLEQAIEGSMPVSEGNPVVYDLAARVMPGPGVSVGFGDQGADLTLPADAPAKWNFNKIGKGTEIGRLDGGGDDPLEIISPLERKFGDYFVVEDGKLLAADDFVPAMLVARRDIIKQDCLCYVLEPNAALADIQRSPNSFK